jgi:hypothetical protein
LVCGGTSAHHIRSGEAGAAQKFSPAATNLRSLRDSSRVIVYDQRGAALDASFSVEAHPAGTTVFFESRGGRRGTAASRNQDYNPGLELLLTRMADLGLTLVDAYVDSALVQNLPIAERRLLGERLPMALARVDPRKLRLQLTRAQRPIARSPGARGAGNRTRRIALVLDVNAPPSLITADLAGLTGSDVVEAEQAVRSISRPRGQDFTSDAVARRAVERLAVHEAERYFQRRGWNTEDVGDAESYDLRCTASDVELRVEVKGTTSSGGTVMLTRNEVTHAREFPRVALFVLSGIRLSRDAAGGVTAAGGQARVVDPWRPSPERLRALAYRYEVE